MREQIKAILKQVLQLEEVRDDISQDSCNKWDSLNHLNLIVELESAFDVSFTPEDIVEMRSLDIIEKKLSS